MSDERRGGSGSSRQSGGQGGRDERRMGGPGRDGRGAQRSAGRGEQPPRDDRRDARGRQRSDARLRGAGHRSEQAPSARRRTGDPARSAALAVLRAVDDGEVDDLTALGAEPVLLGPEILRTSTAAAVALGALGVMTDRWSGTPPD